MTSMLASLTHIFRAFLRSQDFEVGFWRQWKLLAFFAGFPLRIGLVEPNCFARNQLLDCRE